MHASTLHALRAACTQSLATIKMEKKEIIENLYSIFGKYTSSNMHYCDCGCIDPNDVKKLVSKKLRDLEKDDFNSYHGSALYTWGEIEHYQHFLPRILEIHNETNGGGIDLYEITSKLEYAKWTSWEEREIKAIKDFILMDWIEYVNEKESNISEIDFEYYSFFFEINELFEMWKITEEEKGCRNFVRFYYFNGTELLKKGLRIKEKYYDKEFKTFINQENLLEKLEETFFRVEAEDNEYAEKVSIVAQMIEQERKKKV